jgi:hypothetical protein
MRKCGKIKYGAGSDRNQTMVVPKPQRLGSGNRDRRESFPKSTNVGLGWFRRSSLGMG